MDRTVNLDSPSVQSYLAILQGVITRMASNSASGKGWCVGLVSAIVVLTAGKGSPRYIWISLVPIVLFLLLDSYYLGLERLFRKGYNSFVEKLHSGTATIDDIFVVTPGTSREIISAAALAALSPSILPFYGLIVLMLLLVKCWVL